MYTLIRGFCSLLSQKDEYSILILGLDGAGKSTFLEQAKANFIKNHKAFPLNRITTTVGLNSGVRLKFWDLGGQDELQSLWDKDATSVSEVNRIFQDSLQFVGERSCTVRGGSALKGGGIQDGIQWILNQVIQNSVLRPPSNLADA